MTEPGIKLTTYFEERDRSGDRFLADALFDVYERHAMRTSILLRGIAGFGRRHDLHSDRSLTLSENLPAVSIAVDTEARIERALADVLDVTSHGLVSLERAQLADRDLARVAVPTEPSSAVKLTVYGGRAVRSGGQAGYVAAVQLLADAGAAGASVLLGVDGTLHGERRRSRFFSRNGDVPLMLLAIGDHESIQTALPRIAELLDEPVATIERVQICKSDGVRLAPLHAPPDRDDAGLSIWQKLMIHVEEGAKHDGRPLHVALVRQLREAGAAGATVLRGVRGFYGAREPFADRFFSLQRNVPVHVVVVDTPANIQRWWPLIDEATREHGVVTSEIVPTSMSR